MRPTLAVQLFRSFHEPSPIKSEKLLNLLTASFRKQLDLDEQGHGEVQTEGDNPSANPTTFKSKPSRRRSFSEPSPPTDRHFRSILSDPLFNVRKKLLTTKPMDVFDLAVSKGLMTIEICHNCLVAEKRLLYQSANPTKTWRGLEDSGAGLKALKWLKASGSAEDGRYLAHSTSFSHVFIEFAIAEGLQEAIWSDFAKLLSARGIDATSLSDRAGRFLLHFVQTEMKGSSDLDGGISALLRARSLLQHFTQATRRTILRPSTRLISYHCTVLSQAHRKPSASNFAALLEVLPEAIGSHELLAAHLNLYHPTQPSPEYALKYFRQRSRTAYFNDKVISLGLDAAKHLLDKERTTEAREIMDLLQSSLPSNSGIQNNQEAKLADSESWNMALLDGLNLL